MIASATSASSAVNDSSFRSVDDSIDVEAVIREVIAELEARARRRVPGDEPHWWPSTQIAERFGIRRGGSKDSRKRGVRLLMAQLAERRSDLVASFKGYALATDAADLAEYRGFRRRMGLTHLAAESAIRRSEALADTTGQYRMFHHDL
jgi:hypothetical protein